jgi:hypothetical protein
MPIATGIITGISNKEVKSNDTEMCQHNVMLPIVMGISTGITVKEVKQKNTETYQHNDANCYWYLYRYHRQGNQTKEY